MANASTNSRWQFIKSHCNAGMIINSALQEGALWGFGWDLPSVTRNTKDLLLMLGATRFTLTGAQLNEWYSLEKDIPNRLTPYINESVVFYLSVSNQLGYLQSLSRMPWRVLVYEGHQNQTVSDIANAQWANFGPDVELVTLTRNADGDSLPRPFALFLRKSPARGDDEARTVLPCHRASRFKTSC
jgi:hypothetical protein